MGRNLMPKNNIIGFPKLAMESGDDVTRPMALHELPRKFQVDHNIDIIKKRHERVARSINMFWGHRDCAEYLQSLIISGGDGFAHERIGFSPEVMTALFNLARLNESE